MSLLLVAVGVAILYFGGELLVDNASRLGRYYGLSPLVVGLTIVAFGTSSPELAASMVAVFRGAPELALGNVVGSNMANLGLVLGLTALLHAIVVKAKFLYREGLFMLATSALLVVFGANGVIGRIEGVVMFALLVAYLGALFRAKVSVPVAEEYEREYSESTPRVGRAIALAALGIVLLVVGADVLVRGAVGAARDLGVSERIIGLTMVAIGTSLPELASSIVAGLKKEGDIVVGNLVGSNIFNVLAVLGLTASVKEVAVDWPALRLDVWVMLGIGALTLILLRTRLRMARLEGSVILVVYLAYFGYLLFG